MRVKRVKTEQGSHIVPALDDRWSDLTKLRWKAAVVGLDSGVTPTVLPSKVSRKVLGVWVQVRGSSKSISPEVSTPLGVLTTLGCF